MIICTDAGHGGKDPGAVNGSAQEKTLTLAITKKLNDHLKRNGFTIITTRTSDTYPSLQERCNIANQGKSSLFISIHVNSATNKAANGIETYVYKQGGQTATIASSIQSALIQGTGATNRGIKANPELHVLNGTTMDAVLVETGFISNDNELKKLQAENYQDAIASAIAKGVCSYYGIAYKPLQGNAGGNAGKYSDTGGHWAESQINAITEKGIMNGSAGAFRPNDPLTRAEAAIVCNNLLQYIDKHK